MIIDIRRYDEDLCVYEGVRAGALIKDFGWYYIWNGERDDEKNIYVYPVNDTDAELIKQVFENNPNGIESDHSLR